MKTSGFDQSSRSDRKRAEQGSALVMTLLLAAVFLVLGGTYLTVSLTDRTIASNEADGAVAFNLAEAGIEHSIAELSDQDIDALLGIGGSLFTNQSLGDGTYSLTVSNNVSPDYPTAIVPADSGGATNDTDGYLVLTSQGRFDSAERTITVVVLSSPGGGFAAFDYVLFGGDGLDLGGNGDIFGDIGSNADIATGAAVIGDASMTGTIDNPGNVTGTVTTGAPSVDLPDIACPSGPYGPAPTGPGVTFDPVTGDLDIGGGDDSSWAAGTYYFHNFEKCCNGFSNFPAGSEVVIYISGTLNINGNGFVNPNGAANFIQIFACGNDTGTWKVNGNNNTWMTLYAPNHPLEFAGNGHKNGAFVGKTIKKSGNANVVYDSAATQVGGSPVYARVPGTWTELW